MPSVPTRPFPKRLAFQPAVFPVCVVLVQVWGTEDVMNSFNRILNVQQMTFLLGLIAECHVVKSY